MGNMTIRPSGGPPYISFTSKSILKRLFLEGKLPVTVGIYGGKLSKDSSTLDFVTLEHVQPHSKRGHSALSNYALATARNNNSRGDQPLWKVFSKENFDRYCAQFKDLEVPYESGIFKGNSYVENLTKTVSRELKKSGHLNLLG